MQIKKFLKTFISLCMVLSLALINEVSAEDPILKVDYYSSYFEAGSYEQFNVGEDLDFRLTYDKSLEGEYYFQVEEMHDSSKVLYTSSIYTFDSTVGYRDFIVPTSELDLEEGDYHLRFMKNGETIYVPFGFRVAYYTKESIYSNLSFNPGDLASELNFYIYNFAGKGNEEDYKVELTVGDKVYSSDDIGGEWFVQHRDKDNWHYYYYENSTSFIETHKQEILEAYKNNAVSISLIRIDGTEKTKTLDVRVFDRETNIDEYGFVDNKEISFNFYYISDFTGEFYFTISKTNLPNGDVLVYTSDVYNFNTTLKTLLSTNGKTFAAGDYILEFYINGNLHNMSYGIYVEENYGNNTGSGSSPDTESYLEVYYQNNGFGHSYLNTNILGLDETELTHEYVYGSYVFDMSNMEKSLDYTEDGLYDYYYKGVFSDAQYAKFEEILAEGGVLTEKWYLDGELFAEHEVHFNIYPLNIRPKQITAYTEYNIDVHYKTDKFKPEDTGYSVAIIDKDTGVVVYEKAIEFNTTGLTTVTFTADETAALTKASYRATIYKDGKKYSGFTNWTVKVVGNSGGSNTPEKPRESYANIFYQNDSFGHGKLYYDATNVNQSKLTHEYVYGTYVFDMSDMYENIYDQGPGAYSYYFDGTFTDEQYAMIEKIIAEKGALTEKWYYDGQLISENDVVLGVYPLNFRPGSFRKNSQYNLDVHYKTDLFKPTDTGYSIAMLDSNTNETIYIKELTFNTTGVTTIVFTKEEISALTKNDYDFVIRKDGLNYSDFMTWNVSFENSDCPSGGGSSSDIHEYANAWIVYGSGESTFNSTRKPIEGYSYEDYEFELVYGANETPLELEIPSWSDVFEDSSTGAIVGYYEYNLTEQSLAFIRQLVANNTPIKGIWYLNGERLETVVFDVTIKEIDYNYEHNHYRSQDFEVTIEYNTDVFNSTIKGYTLAICDLDEDRKLVKLIKKDINFDTTGKQVVKFSASELKGLTKDKYYVVLFDETGDYDSRSSLYLLEGTPEPVIEPELDVLLDGKHHNEWWAPGVLFSLYDANEVIDDRDFLCSFDGGETFSRACTIELTETTSFDAGVIQIKNGQDGESYASKKAYTVLVDSMAPTYELVVEPKEEPSRQVEISIPAGDEGAGLEDLAYSFNGGAWQESATIVVKENGEVTWKIRDLLGNVTEGSYEVTNIDRKGPNATLSTPSVVKPNETITYSITFNEPVKGEALSCESNGSECSIKLDDKKAIITVTAPEAYSTEVTLSAINGVTDIAGNEFKLTSTITVGRTIAEPVQQPAVKEEPTVVVEETTVVAKAEEVKVVVEELEIEEAVKEIIEKLPEEELIQKIEEAGIQSKFEEVPTTSEKIVNKVEEIKETLANQSEEKVVKSVTAFDLSLFANIKVAKDEETEVDVEVKLQPKAATGSDLGTVVYIPYPQGTDESNKFELWHEIDGTYVQEEVKNTEYGIRTVLTSFSPFLLVETGDADVIVTEPEEDESEEEEKEEDKPIYVPNYSGGSSSSTKLDENKKYSTVPTKAIINELSKGKSATVKLTSRPTVSKDVFATLAGRDATLTFSMLEAGKEVYSLTFNGKEINEAKDANLAVTFEASKVVTDLVKSATHKVMNFAHAGTLPGAMEVRVNVANTFANGTELQLDYLNETTNKLETVSKNLVVTNGYVTFTIDHCSTYVLREEAELDLSAYSLMNMNVYQNSRVTSIKATANGFTVDGYMFEANADCIYGDARNWREIVFVNAEDADMSKAYRKQVTNVYNTWLNSNLVATVNGKYKLNYANYTVDVDPNNMNAYVGNVAGQKMTSGTYLVYMRISNGTTSYLFPLVDRTLDNGTNMENTGTLPAGFSVVDQETRVLTYTVK